MNQTNYQEMIKTAKDHRDDEIEHLRSYLTNLTTKLAAGSSLDKETVAKVQ